MGTTSRAVRTFDLLVALGLIASLTLVVPDALRPSAARREATAQRTPPEPIAHVLSSEIAGFRPGSFPGGLDAIAQDEAARAASARIGIPWAPASVRQGTLPEISVSGRALRWAWLVSLDGVAPDGTADPDAFTYVFVDATTGSVVGVLGFPAWRAWRVPRPP